MCGPGDHWRAFNTTCTVPSFSVFKRWPWNDVYQDLDILAPFMGGEWGGAAGAGALHGGGKEGGYALDLMESGSQCQPEAWPGASNCPSFMSLPLRLCS